MIKTSSAPEDGALNVVLGGRLDIQAISHPAIRPIEADYFLTRFINNFNNFTIRSGSQNNFRHQAGRDFEF